MMGNVSPRAVGAYRLADALSALLIYHTVRNLVNRPKKNIFSIAYDRGHSCGMQEVISEFDEIDGNFYELMKIMNKKEE